MPSDYAYATTATQWGRENVTYGVIPSGGCDLKWPTETFMLNPDANFEIYTQQGTLVPAQSVLGEEWSGGTFNGPLDYMTLPYLADNAFVTGSSGAVGGQTGAYTQSFAPSGVQGRVSTSWAMQFGDPQMGANSEQALGIKITDLDIDVTRAKAGLSGKFIGQRSTPLITPTSSPTTVGRQVMVPGTFDIMLADTAAGLTSASPLSRAFHLTISLGGLWLPVWAIQSAAPSFVALVAGLIKGDVKLTVAPDATSVGSSGLIQNMRVGATKFLRVQAIGPLIPTATTATYAMTLDLALQVNAIYTPQNENGVLVHQWGFTIVNDATWGKWINLNLINILSAFAV